MNTKSVILLCRNYRYRNKLVFKIDIDWNLKSGEKI